MRGGATFDGTGRYRYALWRTWGVETLADAAGVAASGADGTTINWPDALLAEKGVDH